METLPSSVRARLDDLLSEAPPRRAADEPRIDAEEPLPAAAPRRFGRHQLVALCALVLAGVGLAVWQVLSAKAVELPPPVEVASGAPQAGETGALPAEPGGQTPEPSASPAAIVVHVIGAVAKPGLVSLPSHARVGDAINAAGGLTSSARPGDLNLAAHVADGSQIVVGDVRRPGGEVRGDAGAADGRSGASDATGGATPASSGSDKVDLNTATLAQLDGLPGVGPVMAQRILDYRTKHGKFSRIEDLHEIDGVGEKTYERLSGLVRV